MNLIAAMLAGDGHRACPACGTTIWTWLVGDVDHDCARAQAVNAGTAARYEVRRSPHTDVLPWAVVDTVNGTRVRVDDDDHPGPCWATEIEALKALEWIEKETAP